MIKHKPQLIISQKHNWLKKDFGYTIIWFSGYFISPNLEGMRAVNYLENNIEKLSKNIESFLSNLDGHFSFIIEKEDLTICVVDRVKSIPLYWGVNDEKFYVSNQTKIFF